MKPMLTPPVMRHLKLRYDELLSSFPFKFNLRRYTLVRDKQTMMYYQVERCRLNT